MKTTKTHKQSSSAVEEENLSHPKKAAIDRQHKQVFVGRGMLKGRHLLKALMAEKRKERAL
jgi:hypothetical protein